MSLRVGPYALPSPVGLAPMAGVTDLPFRKLCLALGAGFAAGEMISADQRLWHTAKTRRRMDHTGEPEPRIVQIAGGDPGTMAEAAALNAARGAQIIDLNMGCPAKKVCRKAAGSALLRDPGLVREILQATVAAVSVPVTLKIRTGWDERTRNAVEVAGIAADVGVAALAVHGRTRAQRFTGEAEFATATAVVRAVDIPVLANGDIDTPQRARAVLEETGAAGLLIGRAALGKPWLFRDVAHFLHHGTLPEPLDREQLSAIMLAHLEGLHSFYGDHTGVRVARKHIGWYCEGRPDASAFRAEVMGVDRADVQRELVARYFGSSGEVRAA